MDWKSLTANEQGTNVLFYLDKPSGPKLTIHPPSGDIRRRANVLLSRKVSGAEVLADPEINKWVRAKFCTGWEGVTVEHLRDWAPTVFSADRVREFQAAGGDMQAEIAWDLALFQRLIADSDEFLDRLAALFVSSKTVKEAEDALMGFTSASGSATA